MDTSLNIVLIVLALIALAVAYECWQHRAESKWYLVGMVIMVLGAWFIGFGLSTQCENERGFISSEFGCEKE